MMPNVERRKRLVILPTYNESSNLANIVKAIQVLDSGVHILIIDDNSPDGTGNIADQLAQDNQDVSVIHRSKKLGLGSAYVEGFRFGLSNNFNYICEMDADFSHDPKYLAEFFKEIESCDLVMGSRYLNGISIVNWSLFRLLVSFLSNKYVKLVTGMPFSDCNCGFKCFRRTVIEDIDLDSILAKGYAFQMEMLYRVFKKDYHIREIPIIFFNRKFGKSKIDKWVVLESFILVIYLRFLALKKSFRTRKF